jgi:hypothetical protein
MPPKKSQSVSQSLSSKVSKVIAIANSHSPKKAKKAPAKAPAKASPSKKSSPSKKRMTKAEQDLYNLRLANLAKGRAIRAANISAKKSSPAKAVKSKKTPAKAAKTPKKALKTPVCAVGEPVKVPKVSPRRVAKGSKKTSPVKVGLNNLNAFIQCKDDVKNNEYARRLRLLINRNAKNGEDKVLDLSAMVNGDTSKIKVINRPKTERSDKKKVNGLPIVSSNQENVSFFIAQLGDKFKKFSPRKQKAEKLESFARRVSPPTETYMTPAGDEEALPEPSTPVFPVRATEPELARRRRSMRDTLIEDAAEMKMLSKEKETLDNIVERRSRLSSASPMSPRFSSARSSFSEVVQPVDVPVSSSPRFFSA